MILRETRISECWCPSCQAGQMGHIHDLLMKNGMDVKGLIGQPIECQNCGAENVLEDVLEVIPTAFLVASATDLSKAKSNDDLNKWLKS